MSGVTTHYSIIYAQGADETKKFPADVDQKAKETIDKELWEGNKVGAGQVYSAPVGRALATEFEPSATRPNFVALAIGGAAGEWDAKIFCGAVEIGKMTAQPTAATQCCGFVCPAGKVWKVTSTKGTPTISSSYLPL